MLTIFATPKPFVGHAGVIQRNAIQSWLRLGPGIEVILFGDDAGTAEVAAEFGARHEPELLRSEYGTKRLDYMFARAQELSGNELFCYSNCDIVLTRPFYQAAECVAAWRKPFLMVGQRWDTPVTEPINFEDPHWEAGLREFALSAGKQQLPYAVDYFLFTRGLYREMPPFVVGRVCWDHWIVWKARSSNVPVVDATGEVLAVHQNHDFGYHPGGLNGVRKDVESERNWRLAGGLLHQYTIEHATHRIAGGRVEKNPRYQLAPLKCVLRYCASQSWYAVLRASFGLRRALGLHKDGFSGLKTRLRSMVGR